MNNSTKEDPPYIKFKPLKEAWITLAGVAMLAHPWFDIILSYLGLNLHLLETLLPCNLNGTRPMLLRKVI